MYNACMSINEKLLINNKSLEKELSIKKRSSNIDQNTLIKRNEKLNQDLVTAMQRLEMVEIEFIEYKNHSTGKFLDYSDLKDRNLKFEIQMSDQMKLILKLEQENKNLNQKIDRLLKKKRTGSEGNFLMDEKVVDTKAVHVEQENKNSTLELDFGSLKENF